MRRRCDGLHMRVQNRGERVAERAENAILRLDVLVELVRRAEESVGLGHGHAIER